MKKITAAPFGFIIDDGVLENHYFRLYRLPVRRRGIDDDAKVACAHQAELECSWYRRCR